MDKEDLPDAKVMAQMNFKKRKQYLNRVVVVMKKNEQTIEGIRSEANLKKFIDDPSFIEGRGIRKVYHKPYRQYGCKCCVPGNRLGAYRSNGIRSEARGTSSCRAKYELANMLTKLKKVSVEKAEKALLQEDKCIWTRAYYNLHY